MSKIVGGAPQGEGLIAPAAAPGATVASPRNMTREERRAAAAETAKRERREQGLPEFCDDPAVYEFLARALIRKRKQEQAA